MNPFEIIRARAERKKVASETTFIGDNPSPIHCPHVVGTPPIYIPLHIRLDPAAADHVEFAPDNKDVKYSARGDASVNIFGDPRLGFFERADILRDAAESNEKYAALSGSFDYGDTPEPDDGGASGKSAAAPTGTSTASASATSNQSAE